MHPKTGTVLRKPSLRLGLTQSKLLQQQRYLAMPTSTMPLTTVTHINTATAKPNCCQLVPNPTKPI